MGAALAALWPPPLLAQEASVERGHQLFEACSVCHSTEAGGQGLGPTLHGIVGRPAGSVPGYRYSRALKNAHLTWTVQELDRYVADPQAAVPGNRMPYSGMPAAADRASLLAYLETLK
ncbi:MAG TPA: c-type cytochrome [Burkholderiaceae bacterium]|nr:c-type cytochrome [Burkholderiaceae bacterium]